MAVTRKSNTVGKRREFPVAVREHDRRVKYISEPHSLIISRLCRVRALKRRVCLYLLRLCLRKHSDQEVVTRLFRPLHYAGGVIFLGGKMRNECF